MRIELVIDELVLHGFDPRQRHAIGDGVEAGLSHLLAQLADRAGWSENTTLGAVEAVALSLEAGLSGAVVGRRIAVAIASSIPLDRLPAVSGRSLPEGHQRMENL